MELREYWAILRRRWWLPLGLALIALVISSFVALRGASAYRTDMRLAVTTIPTVNASTAQYDPVYYSNLDSEYLADDLSEFLTSEAFASEVSRELNSSIDVRSIVDATRAKKTHRFIDLTITTPTADEGQQIAGSISRIVADPNHIAEYLTALNAYNTHVTIVTPPQTGRAMTPLGLVSDIALRTLIGLFVGIALAFLLDYVDGSVRGTADVEQTLALPVLAEIPSFPVRRGAAATR
jgi:capsular polysaccharide biosynthesis protein